MVADTTDLDVELARALRAPAIARGALRDLCAHRVEGQLLTDAELLVSELVSNAIRHGTGQITLRAVLDADRLRVEVIDGGGGFAREMRRREFDQVGGWGLGLVEDIASRWGIHEGSTHIWFELERAGPRLPDTSA